MRLRPDRWEDYRDRMEELARLCTSETDLDDYAKHIRTCVSLMLHLFEARRLIPAKVWDQIPDATMTSSI